MTPLAESRSSPVLHRLTTLLEPTSGPRLEEMAQESQALTRRFFGRTIRLFAPLYLSNECVNSCAYCGFSRENRIMRVTLEIEGVVKEARYLAAQGFRNILLVSGEHPKFVSTEYLEECLRALAPEIPSLALEIAPMETGDYARLVGAGAEGLIVYQETYDRLAYSEMHTSGPKKDYDWRLASAERAYAGGFRRIGIGALFGLSDWRSEALALAAHLEQLLRKCWKAQFTISFPRLRPAAGEFRSHFPVSDREFVQLICAFRICFPQIGIILSTRESPALRDALIPLGVTMMSAGSRTEPGGYTGQGIQDLHLTVRGQAVAAPANGRAAATEQFAIADDRSPAEVEAALRDRGFDPVWKDWDHAILGS